MFAPTTGVPAGALAGEYVGVSADVGLGLGAGANVLLGGSNRTIALQPLSLRVGRGERRRRLVVAQAALALKKTLTISAAVSRASRRLTAANFFQLAVNCG